MEVAVEVIIGVNVVRNGIIFMREQEILARGDFSFQPGVGEDVMHSEEGMVVENFPYLSLLAFLQMCVPPCMEFQESCF